MHTQARVIRRVCMIRVHLCTQSRQRGRSPALTRALVGPSHADTSAYTRYYLYHFYLYYYYYYYYYYHHHYHYHHHHY